MSGAGVSLKSGADLVYLVCLVCLVYLVCLFGWISAKNDRNQIDRIV
jgi:hypothetical protein